MSRRSSFVAVVLLAAAGTACWPFSGPRLTLEECLGAVKRATFSFQAEIRDIGVVGRNCMPGAPNPAQCAKLLKETREAIEALRQQFIQSAFVKQCRRELSVKQEFLPLLEKIEAIARNVPDTAEEQQDLRMAMSRLEEQDINLSLEELTKACCSS